MLGGSCAFPCPNTNDLGSPQTRPNSSMGEPMKRLTLLAALGLLAACADGPTVPAAEFSPLLSLESNDPTWFFSGVVVSNKDDYCIPIGTTVQGTVTFDADGAVVDQTMPEYTTYLADMTWNVTVGDDTFSGTSDPLVPAYVTVRDGTWDQVSLAWSPMVELPVLGRKIYYVHLSSGGGPDLLSGVEIPLAPPAGATFNRLEITCSHADSDAPLDVLALTETPAEPKDPVVKDDCMDGGWNDFGFKNQGQCVRYLASGKDSR